MDRIAGLSIIPYARAIIAIITYRLTSAGPELISNAINAHHGSARLQPGHCRQKGNKVV
jgi:hypothetical protein